MVGDNSDQNLLSMRFPDFSSTDVWFKCSLSFSEQYIFLFFCDVPLGEGQNFF